MTEEKSKQIHNPPSTRVLFGENAEEQIGIGDFGPEFYLYGSKKAKEWLDGVCRELNEFRERTEKAEAELNRLASDNELLADACETCDRGEGGKKAPTEDLLAVTDKLRKAEAELQARTKDFHQAVGDYQRTIASLKAELRETETELNAAASAELKRRRTPPESREVFRPQCNCLLPAHVEEREYRFCPFCWKSLRKKRVVLERWVGVYPSNGDYVTGSELFSILERAHVHISPSPGNLIKVIPVRIEFSVEDTNA